MVNLIVTGVSILSQFLGGMSKKSNADKTAYDAEKQGLILFAERRRDANLIRRDGEIFAQRQALGYVGAGVKIGGSALITLEHTRRMAGAEASAVERRGKAELDLTSTRAGTVRNEGNASMISSLLNAGSKLVEMRS
jgi:hypothetical protein